MISTDFVAAGGFIALFVLLILRVPIGVAMGIVGVAGFGLLAAWDPALNLLAISPIRTVTDYSLGLIPMFILMGAVASASGMSGELYRAANAFLGHRKGGLAMATITVTLTEKATVLHFAEPQWVWWNEVKGAFHAVVVLLQALATVLTYVGVFGIVWVPIVGVVLFATRRRKKQNDVPPDSA